MDQQEIMLENPFPGLRSFETEENYLFFGRDGQSDEVLAKLRGSRFVAVIGTSGSGKSSLVRAGVLPALFSGHLAIAGSHWRVAAFKPGIDPIGNLAEALSSSGIFGADDGPGLENKKLDIKTLLRRSSLGLIEVVKQSKMLPHENLLVFADQFEELFRFKDSTAADSQDDAAAFVKLLLEATRQSELPIYLILTMRSDYLGEAAQFSGLPEAINEGQYLIPKLTDDGRREAITGPVLISGATITQPLVNRLLNDAGENPNQLPILQHAMMRTWEYWRDNHKDDEPIDIHHYEKIGGMARALSKHADEAYDELSERLRIVAEKIFKSLTEKGEDTREVRRPATVKELSEIAGTGEQDVIAVIETFRREGRSFLMPPQKVTLESNTLIDISHESLISGWERLQIWTNEEAQSARIFKRLADTAALHAEGKSDFYRNPALQLTLDWREKNIPNIAWAKRYGCDYEQSIGFLESSQKNYQAEVEEKERQRQKELEQERELAKRAKEVASERERSLKLLRWGIALLSLLIVALAIAAGWAIINRNNAISQKRIADEQLKLVSEYDSQSDLYLKVIRDDQFPITSVAFSPDAKSVSWGTEDGSYKIRNLDSAINSLSEKMGGPIRSLCFSHDGKKIAVAGKTAVVRNVSLFNLVMASTAGHEDSINYVAFSPNDKMLVTAGADRKANVWDTVSGKPLLSISHRGAVNHASFSPDNKLLVTASDDGTAMVWDLETKLLKFLLAGHLSRINRAVFSHKGDFIATASTDQTVIVWSAATGEYLRSLAGHGANVKSVAFSPDDKMIVTSSNNKAFLWTATSPSLWKPLEAKPAADQKNIKRERAKSVVEGAGSSLELREIKGHTKEVIDAVFSNDGKWIITASQDNTARIWSASTLQEIRSVTGHIGPLTALDFNSAVKYLVTGSRDQTVRIWNLAGITDEKLRLTAQVKADPADLKTNCPGAINFTATITLEGGAGQIRYQFIRKDGKDAHAAEAKSPEQDLSFDSPGSRDVTQSWTFNKDISGGDIILRIFNKSTNETFDSQPAKFSVSCQNYALASASTRTGITDEQLKQIMPSLPAEKRSTYLPYLNSAMKEFGINNPKRQAAFLAQVAFETTELRAFSEPWRNTVQQKRYEPGSPLASSLGNTQEGDGEKYRGRGAFFIVGRGNYQKYGNQLGIDLVNNPELAADPKVAFRTAGLYWQSNGLNELADKGDFQAITKRVGGGMSGLASQLKYYSKAKEVLGVKD